MENPGADRISETPPPSSTTYPTSSVETWTWHCTCDVIGCRLEDALTNKIFEEEFVHLADDRTRPTPRFAFGFFSTVNVHIFQKREKTKG